MHHLFISIVALLGLFVAPSLAAAQDLVLKRVMLSSGGLGYFEYEATVETLLQGLTRDTHALAVEIASLPEAVRGYGHIKTKSVEAARAKREELLARYRAAPVRAAA